MIRLLISPRRAYTGFYYLFKLQLNSAQIAIDLCLAGAVLRSVDFLAFIFCVSVLRLAILCSPLIISPRREYTGIVLLL
jgi:hypothetical protein